MYPGGWLLPLTVAFSAPSALAGTITNLIIVSGVTFHTASGSFQPAYLSEKATQSGPSGTLSGAFSADTGSLLDAENPFAAVPAFETATSPFQPGLGVFGSTYDSANLVYLAALTPANGPSTVGYKMSGLASAVVETGTLDLHFLEAAGTIGGGQTIDGDETRTGSVTVRSGAFGAGRAGRAVIAPGLSSLAIAGGLFALAMTRRSRARKAKALQG